MTPMTKEEPPAKKQRLAIKMPGDMANRMKMPLHVMKGVFSYLSRKKQETLRPVCRFWDRCISTRPSHFHPLFLLDSLSFWSYAPGVVLHVDEEEWWPNVERSLKCCNHLKDLEKKMVGQLFVPTLAADNQISLEVTLDYDLDYIRIRYLFPNKMTKETVHHVLHLASHLGQIAFEYTYNYSASFLRSVHPYVVQLFRPIRCHRLCFYLENSEADVPSLENVLALIKHQETKWAISEENADQSPALVKKILETFAIDTRHFYESTKIELICDVADDQLGWMAFFKMVIELLSNALKNSRQVVPRIKLTFVGGGSDWSIAPFSDMEPISEDEDTRIERWNEYGEEDEDGEPVEVVERIFKYKFGDGSVEQTFDVEVKCKQYEGGEELIHSIRFLFD